MSAVLLPILFPLAGMGWALLTCSRPRVSLAGAMGAIAVAGAACVYVALVDHAGEQELLLPLSWPLPLAQACVRVDGLSAWFLLVIGALSVPVAVYSWGYMQAPGERQGVPAYAALLCLLVLALILVVLAADVVLFLVAWELMSLSAFFLVGRDDRRREVRTGAWTYLVATHLGTGLAVLPMFAVLAARSHSTQFSDFGAALASAEPSVAVGVCALAVVGFGTKAGFVPFHVWLPEAHPVAPSPVSALMSGVVIKTGIYGILRTLSWLPALPAGLGVVLLLLAIVTGVFGILHALGQRQLKRLLAYSSIENVGIILLGIAAGVLGRATNQPMLEALGYAGALLHVLNHAVFKGLLFLSAGAVIHATGTGDMERLGGMARTHPWDAAWFLVAAAAICAVPPLNGFLSEFLLFKALLVGSTALTPALSAASAAGIAALAIMGGLALSTFTKAFGTVYLGTPRFDTREAHATPMSMGRGMALLSLACVALGLLAPAIAPNLARAVQVILPDALPASGVVSDATGTLARPAGMFLFVLFIVAALFRFRAACGGRGAAVDRQPTWGCGFAEPTSRMQYSGGSFVDKLALSFRHVVPRRRQVVPPAGYFPNAGRMESATPDRLLTSVFAPLFAGVARACERCRPLQVGRVQMYLLYLVGTLLLVFAAESWYAPYSAEQVAARAASGRQVSTPAHEVRTTEGESNR
ncbi:MAG: hypothetical protein HY763_02125 [Planctomycetes bacterium]|nr:hypothetical protein [Planctomycetota bacterium]